MIVLGLLLGLVGTDVETGTPRFTFDLPELADGLNFVALSMGVFGLGEIIRNLEHEHTRSVMVKHVSGLMLSQGRLQADHRPGAARHRPGLGAGHPARRRGDAGLASPPTRMEKRLSPNRAQFGKGAIEGVAAPEAANNAGAQTSFIPMLTLGIPSQPGDGADDRGDDHPGHHARPQRGHRRAGAVLGHDRLDVGRQPDAGAAQPAADRACGCGC